MWWEKRRSAALSSACSADGCNQVLSARPVGRTAGNRLNGGGSRQSTAGRPEGGAARLCSAGGVCRIRSRAQVGEAVHKGWGPQLAKLGSTSPRSIDRFSFIFSRVLGSRKERAGSWHSRVMMEVQASCLEDIPNEDVEIPDGIKKTGVETRAPRQPRPKVSGRGA